MEKNFSWELVRHLVDTYEDMQQVRKAEMNRARTLLYRRLLDLGYLVEAKKEDNEKVFGEIVSDESLEQAIEKAKTEGKLSLFELEMINDNTAYGKKFKALELSIQRRIMPVIGLHKIYVEYLSKIKGVGVLTSARLICYLGDCSNFDTISKLWSYSGYGLYDGKIQKREKGKKSNWNSKVKTLGFLIADSFIKQRAKYREIYDSEKIRLRVLFPEKIKVDGKTKYNDGHIHRMAARKMVKIFLANYWLFVRGIYGLPVREPYVFDKLKHVTRLPCEYFFEKE